MFFCAGGLRSALAAQTAQKMGLKPVAHIAGGFGAWKKAGGPTRGVGAKEREERLITNHPERGLEEARLEEAQALEWSVAIRDEFDAR